MTNILKSVLPKKLRLFIFRRMLYPPINRVKSYHLLSTEPVCTNWGEDRGTPIDRYYIENFLKENSDDIKGRVLEIGDNYYTKKFGNNKVTLSEILHADRSNPNAAYIGDLADIPQIPSDTFDCVILTQTLQLIPDLSSAVNTLYRILKKDGVVLVTVPGISKIYIDKQKQWPDYWRFTINSMKFLFNEKFSNENIIVKSYGNVLASIAFLHGMALEELKKEELEYLDDAYQLIIGLKAVKK
jgi:SAM-dependent methyltransferase